MSMRQKPIYVCDNCGKELSDLTAGIITQYDVCHEGSSEIMYGGRSYSVDGDVHYCTFQCFIDAVGKVLGVK